MTTYKLTYYDSRGLAEIIRFIFAQAGVKYEDIRITKEQWPEVKPSIPFGQLPILEEDGKLLAGSGPISRYLAEKYGLAGSNDFENAEIAGIVDLAGDVALKMLAFHFEKDDTRKAALIKEFVENHVPRYFGIVEKLISAKDSPWLYGLHVTYADLGLYHLTDIIILVGPNILENFPLIQKNRDAVSALPNIAQWLKDRPAEKVTV